MLAALPTWVVQIGMGLADPALLEGSDPAEGPLVRIDSVGNVIVAARVWAGADSNVVVAKLSPAGAALWQVEVPGFGDSEDQLGALELAADGGPVVAGLAAGSVFAAAYSPTGTPRWTRKCSTDAGTGGSLGLQVLSGGGAILHWGPDAPGGPYSVARIGSDGALLWARTLGFAGAAGGAVRVVADRQGTVVAAALDTSELQARVLVVTLAPDGSVMREVRLAAGELDSVTALLLTSQGLPVLLTNEVRSTPPYSRCAVTGLDSGGGVQWRLPYPADGSDSSIATTMTLDPLGAIVVLGSRTTPYPESATSHVAFKVSETGELLWDTPRSIPLIGRNLATDPSANILIGAVETTGTSLVKLSPQGAELWRRAFGGCTDIAAGPGGSLAAVQVAQGPVNADLRVLALAPDGSTRWTTKEAPTSSGEVAVGRPALAVDGSGRSVVVGTTYQGGSSAWLIAGIDPSGATAWRQMFRNPDPYQSEPAAVAVDAQGNALVAGYSYGVPALGQAVTLLGQLNAYGPTGVPIWSASTPGLRPSAVLPATNGGFWVAGILGISASRAQLWNGLGSLECEEQGPSDYLLSRAAVDPDGGLVLIEGASGQVRAHRIDNHCRRSWETISATAARGSAVAVGPVGVVAVVGSTTADGAPFVQWIDPASARSWERIEDCRALGIPDCSTGGRFVAAAFGPSGELVATGWTSQTAGPRAVTTVSYGPDRTLRWVRRTSVEESDDWTVDSVGVDSGGTVVVTGSASTSDDSREPWLVTYAPDGRERWVTRWPPSPSSDTFTPVSAVLDPTGGVIMAGNAHVGPDPQITVLRFPLYSVGRFRRHLSR